MKKLILENKELEKDLKEVFFSKKNILTDDEVKKECELGDKIVALLKEDIEEAGINYIDKQEENIKRNRTYQPSCIVSDVLISKNSNIDENEKVRNWIENINNKNRGSRLRFKRKIQPIHGTYLIGSDVIPIFIKSDYYFDNHFLFQKTDKKEN